MKGAVQVVLLSALLISGATWSCTNSQAPKSEAEKIIVATAANVQFAMRELERSFEDSIGIEVDVVVSSSGKLTAQIKQGAPYDILLSANMKYPQSLYRDGWAARPPEVYALGSLVLWTLNEPELQKNLTFLRGPHIDKVAIANPRNAPYGEQAVRALEYYGIYETLKPKLVYGESIAQTNQYILSRACDLGFTAKSVILSPEIKDRGRWIAVPAAAYDPIEQGVIITKHGLSEHPSSSRRFYSFLFSETAATIFERYGYAVPATVE